MMKTTFSGRYSLINCKDGVEDATFGASFALFWPFGDIYFWPFGAIFGVGVRIQNIWRTYLCSQSTFILEVEAYLFLSWPNLGPLFDFLGLSGLFLGLWSGSRTFLGPTYVDNQLWFRKYSPNFWFKFGHILDLFCTFFWAL